MIGILLQVTLAALTFLFPKDPAPGPNQTKTRSRNFDCERVTTETGSHRYPGQIVTSDSRGVDSNGTAVVCRERLTRPGLRAPRDEAILTSLDATATELASAAGSLRPDLEAGTWLVEAYYPSAPVAAKISFAAKNALMRRGLQVSDRTPTLAAGDVIVLTHMTPDDAFPTACRRYFATGSLGEGDTLLAVVNRDPRETILHAGLCTRGQWTWLQ